MEILIKFNGKIYNFVLDDIVMTSFFKDVAKNIPKTIEKKPKTKKEDKKWK